MDKRFSTPHLTPSGHPNKFIDTDLSVYELERNFMLPPISAQVPAQKTFPLESLHGGSSSRMGTGFPIGDPLKTGTPAQLPASCTMYDVYSMVPDKSRKMIKKTIKEKHISKGKMCNMVQQTVEWIKIVCMDVILPALFLCLKEEESLLGKVHVLQKRAEEWKELNSGSSRDTDSHITYNDWMSNDQILDTEAVNSPELAKTTAENIFVCIISFLYSENLSVMPDATCSLDNYLLKWSDSVMTLESSLRWEIVHKSTKDLINCVYQELLANGMGKNLPINYTSSESWSDVDSLMSSRWEFIMFVLDYFSQRTARNHIELFLGLPHELRKDYFDNPYDLEVNWDSSGPRAKVKAERTTLNVLTRTVTDIVMDIINNATDNPLRTAEMFRQGKKSGAQNANDNSSCLNEPIPETSEPDIVNPTIETPEKTLNTEMDLEFENFVEELKVQIDSDHKLQLEDIVDEIKGSDQSECKEQTDSEQELEIEDLLAQSPVPSENSSIDLRSEKTSLKNECNDSISQGQVNEETASTTPTEISTEEKPQNLVLPYHLIERVVDGLLTKLETTFKINIPGIYLSDALINKSVQELANLARIRISGCNQLFPDDDVILKMINEAHDIVKGKNYLRIAWHDDEMATNYLAAVVSAVILDYIVLDGKTQKNNPTKNSPNPSHPNSTVQERTRPPFLTRIRESLRKIFCFKRKRNRVAPILNS